MMIRTLIVEDEPLARHRIRQCLDQESDVQIVGECEDGRSAARAIRQLSPDLVFLDVQIPEMNGFAVLRETLKNGGGPLFVFVTAYGEYALQGFEVNALDYLLKPFDEDRFRETMRRVRQSLGRSRDAVISRSLLDAFERYRGEAAEESRRGTDAEPPLTRLIVKEGGRVFFVKTGEIQWIEAAGNYARAHVRNGSHLIRTSLKELEARLPAGHFARIHRGAIVNLEHVREIQPHLHGDYHVVLNDGNVLRMSRRYRHSVLNSDV